MYAKSFHMLCILKQNNLVESRVSDACLRELLIVLIWTSPRKTLMSITGFHLPSPLFFLFPLPYFCRLHRTGVPNGNALVLIRKVSVSKFDRLQIPKFRFSWVFSAPPRKFRNTVVIRKFFNNLCFMNYFLFIAVQLKLLTAS